MLSTLTLGALAASTVLAGGSDGASRYPALRVPDEAMISKFMAYLPETSGPSLGVPIPDCSNRTMWTQERIAKRFGDRDIDADIATWRGSTPSLEWDQSRFVHMATDICYAWDDAAKVRVLVDLFNKDIDFLNKNELW